MLIGRKSEQYLKLIQSKEKMYEYFVPEEEHIPLPKDLDELFLTTISLLGDFCVNVINNNEEKVLELKTQLNFVSSYFYAYLNGKVNSEYKDYMTIIAAATYYLCDKVGNSNLLVKDYKDLIDIDSGGLENLLICVLKNDYDICNKINKDIKYIKYKKFISMYISIYKIGTIKGKFSELYKNIIEFRKIIYHEGTSRELLIIDIIAAILKIKIDRLAIVSIPQYTSISVEQWRSIINKESFIKELWTSQIELGLQGVYRGNSSVIQMPTSSGKTKSIEIIIRASFLSNRTRSVIIVTPFRALCREMNNELTKAFENDKKIKINEVSEILRNDIDMTNNDNYSIMIVTPEKLMYLIRKDISILDEVGVVIFDEAHLFDDSSRGINYELLITEIKMRLADSAQKVVISAIISNAGDINNWINGESGKVIREKSNLVSEKSIAFADFTLNSNNQFSLHFIENENINKEKFYVPRIVNTMKLAKKGKERKERFFPSNESLNKDLAISLCNKVCINGGVAIFCGKKDSARAIVERILEIKERGVIIDSFLEVSDKDEVQKIYKLFKSNIGEDNFYTKAAEIGVFSHHANIPEGIKSSIEYAMKIEKIRIVVCTSTLAQGVNLPIRYLIIPTIYQSKEEIKVRDFQNLIGRTGRAGMYAEGNIIFTEVGIYNNKKNWKRSKYQNLLDEANSEPCGSYILNLVSYKNKIPEIFDYIFNQYEKYDLSEILNSLIMKIDNSKLVDEDKEIVKQQSTSLINIIKELENYIIPIFQDNERNSIKELHKLIENTFAYYLADESEKNILKETIIKIFNKVKSSINLERKSIYGRTMLSLKDITKIEEWISSNIDNLNDITSINTLVDVIFNLILEISIPERKKNKINMVENLINLYKLWINGSSYIEIQNDSIQKNIKIRARVNYNNFKIDEIIEICNNYFGYKTSIILSAVQEILQAFSLDNMELLLELLDELCRRTRYGLASIQEVILYEMGFNDRVIVAKIKKLLGIASIKKSEYVNFMKMQKDIILEFLSDMPSVFTENFKYIIK